MHPPSNLRSARPCCALAAALAALLGSSCSKSPVLGTLCDPGVVRCDQNAYEVCADDGARYVTLDDCSATEQVCVLGSGCLNCQPNQRSCDGFDIVRCRPDGSTEDRLTSCNPLDGDVCFGGACINACDLAAANRSYEGCEYCAVDLDNAVVADQGTAAAQQFSVVVSNTSQLTAEVTVEIYCTAEDAANPAIQCTEGQAFPIVDPFRIAPGELKIIDLDPREVDGSSSPELNDGPGTFVSHARLPHHLDARRSSRTSSTRSRTSTCSPTTPRCCCRRSALGSTLPGHVVAADPGGDRRSGRPTAASTCAPS